MTGKPEQAWIDVLTGHAFVEAAQRVGVTVDAAALAAALVDCGLVVARDEVVQVYRTLGFVDELAFLDLVGGEQTGKRTAHEWSLRAIERKTGIPKSTLLDRRRKLLAALSGAPTTQRRAGGVS